jgi:hypothetical protein
VSNNDRELRGRIAELERRFPPTTPDGPEPAVTEAPINGVDYVRNDGTWVPANYFSGLWGDLGGVPAAFPPESHTHVLSEITDAGTMAAQNDAPSDGNQYARVNGTWQQVSGGVTVFRQETQPTANAIGDWWLSP